MHEETSAQAPPYCIRRVARARASGCLRAAQVLENMPETLREIAIPVARTG